MNTDKIILSEMEFYGYHGVNQEEKIQGQKFVVDLEINCSLLLPGQTDDLNDTVNYSQVYKLIKSIVEGPSQNLIESVAENIAYRILNETSADEVTVKVAKLQPPIKGSQIKSAAAQITRTISNYS
ncbi:MAG: dihydroneopterin aldolase [Dehalococcoidia bacterium]